MQREEIEKAVREAAECLNIFNRPSPWYRDVLMDYHDVEPEFLEAKISEKLGFSYPLFLQKYTIDEDMTLEDVVNTIEADFNATSNQN